MTDINHDYIFTRSGMDIVEADGFYIEESDCLCTNSHNFSSFYHIYVSNLMFIDNSHGKSKLS